MRSGKAKESADATENDGKKKKKQKIRFGKRFLAGVGKGLRELAVASSAVVVGAALTKLATREMRKPRDRKWTGALFAAKGGGGKDEADATPADFVEGWKPGSSRPSSPLVLTTTWSTSTTTTSCLRRNPPAFSYPCTTTKGRTVLGTITEYGYEEETPSGLLIPVHVGDDYY